MLLLSPCRPASTFHTTRHRRRRRLFLLISIPTIIFLFFLLLLHHSPSTHQAIQTYYTDHALPFISSSIASLPDALRSKLYSHISHLHLLPADPAIPEAAATSGPANATLGFGAVAVVSASTTSERMRKLLQAANVTGLDLSVPAQKTRTDEDVRKFRSGELVGPGGAAGPGTAAGEGKDGKPMGKGSILAWLGHLDVLEWYVSVFFMYSSC